MYISLTSGITISLNQNKWKPGFLFFVPPLHSEFDVSYAQNLTSLVIKRISKCI